MKNNLIFLKQVEVEPPAIVQETLTPKLFDKLKMKPIPLRMFPGKDHWDGFCSLDKYTEREEVVISAKYLEEITVSTEESRKRNILNVYLHEVAHRLDKGSGHTGTFLAINILLRLRSGEEYLMDWVHLYDFKDEAYDPNVYGWAWSVANELNQADLSVEKCVDVIHSRQQTYLDDLQDTQNKLVRAERSIELAELRIGELKRYVASIKTKNRDIFLSGLYFGAFISGAVSFFVF